MIEGMCNRYVSPDSDEIEHVWHTEPTSRGPGTWVDKATGEVVERYTLLTVNADDHPVMCSMRTPDPTREPDQQDKQSVVAIKLNDLDRWHA